MDSTTQKLVNDALARSVRGAISEKNEGINILQQQVNNLSASLADAQNDLNKKTEELEEAEETIEFYKNLLCQPMSVIAQKNINFKATYEAQMQTLADWMVSQKAFKELAIQFGFEKGLSVEQVVQMGKSKKVDVIENKNDLSHKTNALDDEFITKRIDLLKMSLTNQK